MIKTRTFVRVAVKILPTEITKCVTQTGSSGIIRR
jgi:hypothetical protein